MMTRPDNVVYGPVTLQPGESTKIDDRAWQALELMMPCNCPHNSVWSPAEVCELECACCYMLMHYEPSGNGSRLVAAFKHRFSRIYRRVSFCCSIPDMSQRAPRWEPERDYVAQLKFVRECERMDMNGDGPRRVLEILRKRLPANSEVA